MWVEYYNNRDFEGVPDIARYENQDINYDWGEGLVTTTKADNVSVRWQTKLVAPYSETYALSIDHDPAFALYLDGELKTDAWYYDGA